MIRFLDAAGRAAPIYAVEVDGVAYTPEEVAAIVRVQQGNDGAKVCDNGAQLASRVFCEVPGCGEKRTGLSRLCKKHDMRFRRHGDPTIVMHAWDRKKEKGQT